MAESRDEMQALYLPLAVDPSPLTALSLQRLLHEAVAVAVDIGLFRQLKTARTADELAAALAVERDVTYCLLKVLTHLGCLRESGDGFVNAPLADAYLLDASYLYLGHEFVFQPAADSFASQLAAKLRNSGARKTPEPAWSRERLRQIGVFGLMGSIQKTLSVCSLDGAGRLLDLGGGHGFYGIAFAQKYPGLKVTIFDLPHIVALAEQFMRMFGVERQVSLAGGNFLTDDIGSGYDAVLCANILHSDKRDIVLPKVRQALRPGGRIFVRCRVADCADNLENAAAKLRWQVCGGRELYTVGEWRAFLAGHGFRNITLAGMEDIYATIIADG
jgi:predicted O-methyltransferase YrrM